MIRREWDQTNNSKTENNNNNNNNFSVNVYLLCSWGRGLIVVYKVNLIPFYNFDISSILDKFGQ